MWIVSLMKCNLHPIAIAIAESDSHLSRYLLLASLTLWKRKLNKNGCKFSKNMSLWRAMKHSKPWQTLRSLYSRQIKISEKVYKQTVFLNFLFKFEHMVIITWAFSIFWTMPISTNNTSVSLSIVRPQCVVLVFHSTRLPCTLHT